MRFQTVKLATLCTFALFAPHYAFAHVGMHGGAGFTADFASGATHPLAGLDHMLAMILTGILAWQLGGRALWLVPGSFVIVIAVSGVLGAVGVAMPFVEAGIALSLVGLGAVVAFGVRLPTVLAMGVVGLFAIFHGYAHGVEMPESAAGLSYGLGFISTTALLHRAGISVGAVAHRANAFWAAVVTRAASGAAACVGGMLFVGVL